MGRIIPDYLSDGSDTTSYSGSAFNSVRMLLGEVQELVQPNDPRSVSKKFVEYRVWAQTIENGVCVSRMFENVAGPDAFGSGISDTCNFTFRGASSANIANGNNKLGFGKGSKVLMVAIMGMQINYVIISGLRDSNSTPDDPTLGHHIDFEFNGISVNINNDGELIVTYGGATKIDGTNRDDVDESAIGTSISITKDGSLSIVDKDANESIVIDRPGGNLNVTASSGVSISAPQIKLGPAPNSPAVIGSQLVNILTQIITALTSLTVTVAGAPSSPPINAPILVAIQAQLNTILSQCVSLQ